MNFKERLYSPKPIVVDGAMGTMLFQKVPFYSNAFEMLNIEKPNAITEVHKYYVDAGADLLETNTFGGCKIKLSEFNLGNRCEEINARGAEAARKAIGNKKGVYVGGSVGPSGLLIEPMGETNAEIVYESYIPQMIGLEKGGADVIVIETMNDIQEARMALLAAKDHTSLPVICSMTFEENERTVSGTDMVSGLATLAQMGADVVGANCSMGPTGLIKVFENSYEELKKIQTPISVWSNAGMPEVIDGETIYKLSPKDFAESSMKFIDLGISVIGGCCGTSPDHINALRNAIDKRTYKEQKKEKKHIFTTSRTAYIDIEKPKDLLVVGERLNPTARKKFAADLKEGSQIFLREDSKKQVSEGAHILDINVGVPNVDEVSAMHKSIVTLSGIVTTPLMIDTDNEDVLEKALINYPGIPIINSINGTTKSLETLVPIVKRFGTYTVALCLDDSGIHIEAEKRIEIGDKIIKTLENNGIDSSRIFIDPLVLTESAEPGSAMETLKVIEYYSKKGIKTSLGLSNISFGLPQRKFINNTYLKMATDCGATATIINPASMKKIDSFTEEEQLAYNFLTGKDENAVNYIAHFQSKEKETTKQTVIENDTKEIDKLAKLFDFVVEGNIDEITDLVKLSLNDYTPTEIMNNGLLKGLEKVGDLYSTGEYFLPQMIASANTMKKGFVVIQPLLKNSASKVLGKLIICTVKGDVHDIGKNIVAMMLENHGFEIYDLGKDISADEIIEKAKEIDADIICLSSLLTTTMNQMKIVSEKLKMENLDIPLLIGGAVVNDEYAKSIGATYSNDAVEAVAAAKLLLKV